jgi:hypothetical protein
VWIQGIKDGAVWMFHDKTPFPDQYYCPATLTDGSDEIHIRYEVEKCEDALSTDEYHYMCEIILP